MKKYLSTVITLIFFTATASADTWNNSYYQKDRAYVRPNYRTNSNYTTRNNYSYYGNSPYNAPYSTFEYTPTLYYPTSYYNHCTDSGNDAAKILLGIVATAIILKGVSDFITANSSNYRHDLPRATIVSQEIIPKAIILEEEIPKGIIETNANDSLTQTVTN